VLSDLNGSYGSTDYRDDVSAAVAAIQLDPPDLVLSTGDMVAGQRSGLDYAAMWDAFHATVSDPLASVGVPFAITPGNHDASGYAGYEEERDAYEAAWADRRPDVVFVDDAEWPFRYSFKIGDVLFVSLDDTLVGPMDDEQHEWLDQALDHPASARIVFGHVPLYPFAEGRESEALFDEDLEDLLVARGVTAFISGHHHAYYPGRRGDLRLVGTACLGDGPRALIGTDDTSDRSLLRLVIEGGEITRLEAYGGDSFDEVIDRATLPESVGTGGDVIARDDR
jgi:3',5'-cyclic AMP phosphodiesterase CpdA